MNNGCTSQAAVSFWFAAEAELTVQAQTPCDHVLTMKLDAL